MTISLSPDAENSVTKVYVAFVDKGKFNLIEILGVFLTEEKAQKAIDDFTSGASFEVAVDKTHIYCRIIDKPKYIC